MRNKILVLGVILLLCACATGPLTGGTESKIKPCDVIVPIVENIFLGKESVTLAPAFQISNPNDFQVSVKSLSYEVSIMPWYLGGDNKSLDLYVPAKGKITVSGAFPIKWVDMSLYIMQIKGVSMAQAMGMVLPVWKGLNGELFNDKLKEDWGKAPAEHPLFSFKGQLHTMSPGGQELRSDYSTTFKMSSDVGIYK